VGEKIAFAVAAVGILGFGIGVVFLKDAFRAAVALIGTLLSVSLLFVILSAPFVAAIQVIVYAGAIVVLFLFVIAYLGDRGVVPGPDRLERFQVFGWLALGGLGAFGAIAILGSSPGPAGEPPAVTDVGSPAAIGHAFLDSYLVPFEATSLVLLVAAVGAVLLAKRAVQLEGGR